MKRLLITLAILGATTTAAAIGGIRHTVYSANAITTTTTGSAVMVYGSRADSRKVRGMLVATNNGGTTPTLDCTIEHAPQCDGNEPSESWKELLSFTQITTGSDQVEFTTPNEALTFAHGCVRSACTLGGTSPDYDIDVYLFVE